jgi:hypothetical protein
MSPNWRPVAGAAILALRSNPQIRNRRGLMGPMFFVFGRNGFLNFRPARRDNITCEGGRLNAGFALPVSAP